VTTDPARFDTPGWVTAVNEGGVIPISLEAARPFSMHVLLDAALARRGMAAGDVGAFCAPGPGTGDDFLEPFELLLESLEHDAALTILGRWITHRFLDRLLDVRLQIAAYVREDPDVRDEQIREPIVVIGAPRTGTTALHALLAADHRHRVPLGWELLRPVPPPQRGEQDGRVELADVELRLPQTVSGGLESIHAYSGRMHKECLSAMSFTFRSEEFVSRYATTRYIEWLGSCDMTPAYEMHRLVLQILQRRQATARWVLKSPVHLHNLAPLLATYPDARLIVTHRDPLAILGSVTSLIATLRGAHSDHVSVSDIARYHADLYRSDLDGLRVRAAQGFPADVLVAHASFDDLRSDPQRVVAKVYSDLQIALPDEVREAVAITSGNRAAEAAGAHAWSFESLGLGQSEQRDRFAAYCETFSVAEEIR
jgi:hypothetical protein